MRLSDAASSSAKLDELLRAVEELGQFDFDNPADKQRAMQATRAMSYKLMTSMERMTEMWGAVSRC